MLEIRRGFYKDLDENQILIKVMYLSIDPYMRGRMNDMKSYTEPVAIGEVMTGESVGQVIQSRSEKSKLEITLQPLGLAVFH